MHSWPTFCLTVLIDRSRLQWKCVQYSNSQTQPENTGVRNKFHRLYEQTRLSWPNETEWPKAVVFCVFFFFLLDVFSLTHSAASLPELRACTEPLGAALHLHLPTSWRAAVGCSRRPPLPALAGGPSPSGEPSENWRCGAAGQHGGPGAAGSPWRGLGPWEKKHKLSITNDTN